MKVRDYMIHKKVLEERKAHLVEFPDRLSVELKQFLVQEGIQSLYAHQAEMFDKVVDGNNVVITTSTASGKTLSFLLPVINDILTNPLARAIFIYPTKALASDQYRAMEPYLKYFGQNRINAGVYDGDTPVNERSRIRNSANIILTNPEMLNGAFLPNHSNYGFDFIFSNLKYIVIDELHTYRGAFGSHLANVFRRLNRVCKYYNTSPKFLCSSATIANPVELASNICGKDFDLVFKDGSPAPERTYYIIQPPIVKGSDYRVSISTLAANLIPDLVVENSSFIAFAKSRKAVEVILKEARDKLMPDSVFSNGLSNEISGYRGGYTPLERREIENKMISGTLKGLIATNALELGIDIGKIDTTVLTGYPGTRASFWQQSGRAGRNGRKCTNYLILDNLPSDQYIAVDPAWLFETSNENAVIDKNNLFIQLAHIRAAAAELALTLDDIVLFPDLGEVIPVLIKAKELTNQSGKFAWSGKIFPAGDFNLRNIDKTRYKLINKEHNTEITEMDEMQAFRELHQGAIYMHDGGTYQVLSLDLETKTAISIATDSNYYTQPMSITMIKTIQDFKEKAYHKIICKWGDINVRETVIAYQKLQFHNHQNLGFEQLLKPLSKDYDTEGIWIKVPANVVTVYRSLLQNSENLQTVRNNYFEGLSYAILNCAMMAIMSTKEDIDARISNNALSSVDEKEVYIFVYDKFVGGLGYSEKIFDLMDTILENSINMVKNCKCKNGCPACVGNYMLDKSMVLWGLKNFIEQMDPPETLKLPEQVQETILIKEFEFSELAQKWSEFVSCIENSGNMYSGFMTNIKQVRVKDNQLILMLSNEFYKKWVLEKENKKSIENIIHYYAKCPSNMEIGVEIDSELKENSDTTEKLYRRYDSLRH